MNYIVEKKYDMKEMNEIRNFARDAIKTYTHEGQDMDVGSVSDMLNRQGGIAVILKSSTGLNRIRGNAIEYEGKQLAKSIIDACVYASSEHSIGSQIAPNELDSINLHLAPVEQVIVTKKPIESVDLSKDIVIFPNIADNWIFPTQPVNNNWSKQEYLSRVCLKSQLSPDYWKNNPVVILRTNPFYEINPNGNITKLS